MSKTARHIINIVSAVLLTAVLTAGYISGVSCRAPLKCTGLNVVIKDSSANRFVTKADIEKFLNREYGEYAGKPLDSLDLTKVEKIVDSRSAVYKSEAFTTRDGKLNITVTQRTPVVRFQKSDGGFYADAEGFLFPLQSSYASRVQVIDGDIPLKANSGYKGEPSDPKEKEWLMKVLNVVNYMESSKLWRDKIVQITVSDGGAGSLYCVRISRGYPKTVHFRPAAPEIWMVTSHVEPFFRASCAALPGPRGGTCPGTRAGPGPVASRWFPPDAPASWPAAVKKVFSACFLYISDAL